MFGIMKRDGEGFRSMTASVFNDHGGALRSCNSLNKYQGARHGYTYQVVRLSEPDATSRPVGIPQ